MKTSLIISGILITVILVFLYMRKKKKKDKEDIYPLW